MKLVRYAKLVLMQEESGPRVLPSPSSGRRQDMRRPRQAPPSLDLRESFLIWYLAITVSIGTIYTLIMSLRVVHRIIVHLRKEK